MRTTLSSTTHFTVAFCLAVLLSATSQGQAPNQPPNQPPAQKAGNFQNAAIGPGGQNGFLFGPGANLGNNNNANGNGNGARGAAANADFDTLIDLIQSTVATDTWSDNGGGQAQMRPFPGGVLVDAGGMLRLKAPAKGGVTSSDLAAK